MAETILSYVDYCKELIRDEIENFEGDTFYACDLASELTMDGNMNGTFTFSAYEARQILKSWWDDLHGVNRRIYDELGYDHDDVDVFDTPEKYHVFAVIEGVDSIMSALDIIQENWNEKIELTRDVIDTILDQLDGVREVSF